LWLRHQCKAHSLHYSLWKDSECPLPTSVKAVPVAVLIGAVTQFMELFAHNVTGYAGAKLSAIDHRMIKVETRINACPENLIEQIVRVWKTRVYQSPTSSYQMLGLFSFTD
jgi:hypothetical protein